MRDRLLTRLGVIAAAGVVLQSLLPHLSAAAGLVVCCVPIAVAGGYAAAGFWRQARAYTGRQRAGMTFGSAASALLGVSYLLYTIDALAGGNALLDGAADVTAISGAVVAVPAILTAVPPFPNRLARATYVIDVVTVAGAIFATAWQFVLEPATARLLPGDRLLLLATVVPEIVAAALALMLMSRADARRYHAMRVLAGGLGLFALAALVSLHNNTSGEPWYANGLGGVYLAAGLVIALASRSTLEVEENSARSPFKGMWSTLPLLPATVAVASVVVPYVSTGTLSAVLVGTLLGTTALAVLRQYLNSLLVRTLVTDLEEQRRRLDHLAHHDTLTGLPNRAAFHTRGGAELARTAAGTVTAVLLIDLDGFKAVNDSMGHAAGDALLAGAAARIAGALRPGDIPARLGGDEFAVIVPKLIDLDEAVAVGDRIVEALAAPMSVAGTELRVCGSAGVTITAGPGASLEHLLHEADTALYAAKAAGKGRVRVFDSSSSIRLPDIVGA